MRAAAKRRLEEEAARKALATLGLPVEVSPSEALLEEVHRTAGHVAWLGRKVQELDETTLTWDTTKVETLTTGDPDQGDDKGRGPASRTTQTAAVSVWYQLYAQERAHLVKVSEAALKAGVEERRVRLAEQQGQLVGGLVQRVLGALFDRLVREGIEPDRLRQVWGEAVREIVPREFRALAGS